MPYILDGQNITGKKFTVGTTMYPSRWINGATAEEISALGIIWVEPEPYIETPYIPTIVTMRQARLQLIALGVYQQVNEAVVQMGEQAQIEWEYAAIIERDNPFVQSMIQLLNWTEVEADDFFIDANLL